MCCVGRTLNSGRESQVLVHLSHQPAVSVTLICKVDGQCLLCLLHELTPNGAK